MIFNSKTLINPFNQRPAPQSHRQSSGSPKRSSSNKRDAINKSNYRVSNSMNLQSGEDFYDDQQYYTPKVEKTQKKKISSVSGSPASKTTSKKGKKKSKDKNDTARYLPSIESQQVQKLAENLMDQEQQTIFSSPQKENLYLQRIKLQEEYNVLQEDNIKAKTRVQALETNMQLMAKRLSELKEQQKAEMQSSTYSNKQKQQSISGRSDSKDKPKQEEHIQSMKEMKSSLKVTQEEGMYKEDQIENIKNVLKHTEIGVLEDQRMAFFESVISLRQNLDKTLLHNKLAQLIKDKNLDGVEKVFSERTHILQQDKQNLAEQYQKLWNYNQQWIQKIESKQLERHELKVKVKKVNDDLDKAKKDYQKLLYNRKEGIQSAPKALAKLVQKHQEDNRIKDLQAEHEALLHIVQDKQQQLSMKEDEQLRYERKSKEELGEVKVVNSDLREKILELRRQNDELFKEIRVKTQKIIEAPEFEITKKRRSMMIGVNQEDTILNSTRQIRRLSDLLKHDDNLEGFEFSSMNKAEQIARLNIYKLEINKQHEKIQGIIRGDKDGLKENSLSENPPIDKLSKTPAQPLTQNEIQNKTVLNDNLEDLPLNNRKRNSQKVLENLAIKSPQADRLHSELIKKEQENQYNKKQADLLNSKKEEDLLKLKELELLEQQKNLLLQKQIEIDKLEELKKQHHEKEMREKLAQQQAILQKQKTDEERKLEKLIKNDKNAEHKNMVNSEMAQNDNQQYKPIDPNSNKENKALQTKRLSVLSQDQWKQIQKHIEQQVEMGDKNQAEKIISQTVQSITEPNVTDGDQFEVEYVNNPKHYVDSIITKFDYEEEKKKYLQLIQDKNYKEFPNAALKNRHLDQNVTQNQIDFLENALNFDFVQFSGDIKQKRAEKSLNNQKYLMSGQPFSDQIILQSQEFDFSHFMNSEDLTRNCEEHYSKKNILGNINFLLQNEAFIKLFTKNFLVMQVLNKDQFKIGEKISSYSQESKAFKGLINQSQQQVSILKIEVNKKEDLVMYSQDISTITQMKNPFILHPIASFIESNNSTDSATYYRVYPPFKQSLKDYFTKSLSKLNYENKLMISLQICMGVFAIHCKNVVIGGQIDLENIIIQEGEKNVQLIKFIQIFSPVQVTENENQNQNQNQNYFRSPEAVYNRMLEFRSDVYSLGLLLYKIFTNTDSTDKNKILSDPKVPASISKVLPLCLQENYRDRISSAGLSIYLQYLLFQENPEVVNKVIFNPLNNFDTNDGLFADSFKILPYENSKAVPLQDRGFVYLENGCYYGTLNKNKQFNCEKSYIFQYDPINKVVCAFISNFQNNLYQFSFSFNTKLETLNIYQREKDKIWFADSNSQELLETKSYKGFTLIPDELQINFIDFVIQKKFKLLDDAGSLIIGEYGQNGLNGIGCKLNQRSKHIQIGIYEHNHFNSDGIHYHQSRIYNYMPQKDYKLKDRGMCEYSNALQIGPLKQPKYAPSIFLKYTDNKEVQAKVIRNTVAFRIEYILMNELVVICMQNQKVDDPSSERILVVTNKDLQLHSFLPASNTAQISDMHLQLGYLGIAVSIDRDEVYIGHFAQNSKEMDKNNLFINQGYFLTVDEIKKVSCVEIKKIINNITIM
ncbi:F-box protein (macronuclear) [Tetrahymena thermophila SB210]|uniref:F-box protein n=1 Tax=Tetrahymena thermophila (strain SB210) TaxID=312017 RepID=I7MEW7_TETTS|nr:F-box protein [Tetrahymena thermophila SB210]EAR97941.2 F-box protein [Tetrahymena thermophila SB210]|eukprot:XP_001018186.2 F-box protein [Tetrahymena thermophila SB210]